MLQVLFTSEFPTSCTMSVLPCVLTTFPGRR